MAEYFGGGEPISPLYLRGFPFEVVNPSSLELPKDESQDNPKDLFTPGLPFFAQAARIASLDGLTGSLPIGYSEPNNLQDIYLTHPSTPNWDLEIGTFSDPVILEYIGDSPVGCYISADTSPLHGVYAQDSPCLWNIPSIIEDSGRINPDPIATPLFDVTETIIFEEPETKDASPTPFLDGYSKNKDPQRCRVSTAMDFVCPQCSTGFGKLFLLRKHVNRRHNRRFQCQQIGCDQPPFGLRTDLQRHERALHAKDQVWKCQVGPCERIFNRRDNMLRHSRSSHDI